LRDYARRDDCPEDIRRQVQNAEFVPDELVDRLLYHFLQVWSAEDRVVNGYPRSESQYEHAWTLDQDVRIFYIDLPLEVAKRRLLKRDRGSEDTEARIRERFAKHQERFEFLSRVSDVQVVDGTGPPEQVHERIVNDI
jgi:adenylate kinase family enzyme